MTHNEKISPNISIKPNLIHSCLFGLKWNVTSPKDVCIGGLCSDGVDYVRRIFNQNLITLSGKRERVSILEMRSDLQYKVTGLMQYLLYSHHIPVGFEHNVAVASSMSTVIY